MSYKFIDIFPTRIILGENIEIADRLLPLCNYYTGITNTTLLNIPNYPSTLQNNELSDKINSEPIVIEAFEYIEGLIREYKKTLNITWEFPGAEKYGFFSSMNKNTYLRKHRHLHCTFSGLIYLETGKDVPPLIMHDPNAFVGGNIKIEAVKGRVLIWPCWLEHELDLKINDNPRKVFTFNI